MYLYYNELDKIYFKIEDKNQALLLLPYLPFLYKIFKESIIYEDKSTIKVNEVKEYLQTNKIDKQLMVESHYDDSRQVFFLKEKSNNESLTSNLKQKNLMCDWNHKKGHTRADCWTHKNKQQKVNTTELAEGDEDKCDVLSITYSVSNKDKWIIDFECSQHISFNRKLFSLCTSVQRGEVFMKNSATSKLIGERTIQFYSHDGCITTLQSVHHVLESKYNLISWRGINFISEGDLVKVFKDANVKFQAERVRNIYMLRNSDVTASGFHYARLQDWSLWNNQRLR